MRPTRLVAVTATGQVSGAERVLARTLTAAVVAGWEVTCVAPSGPLADELAAGGVNTVRIPELGLAPGPRAVAVGRTVRRWAAAARQVRRTAGDADVVLVNALNALPVVRLAHVGPPVVWLAHDVVVRPDRLRVFRASSPALSAVVGVSAAVADRLRGGTLRVLVVHNGVSWPVEPAPATQDTQVVGINALLTPWKGHDVLLDAVELLPDGVRVEVMGGRLPKDEEYAAGVHRRSQEPALEGTVEVLGHVPDPLARMRTWSVAVSASTEPEACPLNVLEAMSLGVPVVATDHGGAPEVLAGSGVLVPPGDAAALAGAITRLLADAPLRQRCAAAGRERVATAHRADVQTQALLDVLAEEAGR